MKNCDLGLENAALGLRPRAAFSRPRSQFFTIRTDPKPVNNIYISKPSIINFRVKEILELTEVFAGFNSITNRITNNETNKGSFEKKHYVAPSREMKTAHKRKNYGLCKEVENIFFPRLRTIYLLRCERCSVFS